MPNPVSDARACNTLPRPLTNWKISEQKRKKRGYKDKAPVVDGQQRVVVKER